MESDRKAMVILEELFDQTFAGGMFHKGALTPRRRENYAFGGTCARDVTLPVLALLLEQRVKASVTVLKDLLGFEFIDVFRLADFGQMMGTDREDGVVGVKGMLPINSMSAHQRVIYVYVVDFVLRSFQVVRLQVRESEYAGLAAKIFENQRSYSAVTDIKCPNSFPEVRIQEGPGLRESGVLGITGQVIDF